MAEIGSKVANIGFDLITIKLLSPQTSPSLKICKINEEFLSKKNLIYQFF